MSLKKILHISPMFRLLQWRSIGHLSSFNLVLVATSNVSIRLCGLPDLNIAFFFLLRTSSWWNLMICPCLLPVVASSFYGLEKRTPKWSKIVCRHCLAVSKHCSDIIDDDDTRLGNPNWRNIVQFAPVVQTKAREKYPNQTDEDVVNLVPIDMFNDDDHHDGRQGRRHSIYTIGWLFALH